MGHWVRTTAKQVSYALYISRKCHHAEGASGRALPYFLFFFFSHDAPRNFLQSIKFHNVFSNSRAGHKLFYMSDVLNWRLPLDMLRLKAC